MDRTVVVQFKHRGSAVFEPTAFDHRDQRAVVDAINIVQVILVTVPLEHGQYMAGVLQNATDFDAVFDAMIGRDVQSLMGKYDRRKFR